MVGKVVKKENSFVLLSVVGNLPISYKTNKDFENKIKNLISINNEVWVEFVVESISIKGNEHNIIDYDVAVIEFVYDEAFSTINENVSIATKRYEKNIYPVGGFAPGFYTCKCVDCKGYFVGDKQSSQCEKCAINKIIK
jgi:hypothetical protein